MKSHLHKGIVDKSIISTCFSTCDHLHQKANVLSKMSIRT